MRLVLGDEDVPAGRRRRPVRRRLYGSSKVALSNFGENEENEAPLGAVRTWGRAECRILLENAHGRVVGAATVSVSLASLDALFGVPAAPVCAPAAKAIKVPPAAAAAADGGADRLVEVLEPFVNSVEPRVEALAPVGNSEVDPE